MHITNIQNGKKDMKLNNLPDPGRNWGDNGIGWRTDVSLRLNGMQDHMPESPNTQKW